MSVSFLRTIILYVVVIAAIRVMGKRTIGEMQATELVVTLMISDIASVPMQENGIPLLSGIIPITVLVALEVLLSVAMMKKASVGRLLNGSPVTVIKNGEVVQSALKKLRMTNEDLFEALRKNGSFDMLSVDYAVVETDGTLSVLEKGDASMSVLMVSDGDVDVNSIKLIGWDLERIHRVALAEKVDIRDIFIMTGKNDGSYNIVLRDKTDSGVEKRKR